MNQSTLNVQKLLLLLVCLLGAMPAHASQTLTGQVSKDAAAAKRIGDLKDTETLHITFGLAPQNLDLLKELARQVYDPQSSKYHHFLKKGEFGKSYGPSAADYQKVLDFAKVHHLNVEATYSHHLLVALSGTAKDIGDALHLHFGYGLRKDGSKFHRPDADPSLDLEVPLSHIGGLDNYILPHPSPNKVTRIGRSKPQFTLGSAPEGNISAKDIRTAYAPNVGLTGKGQSVALFEKAGFYPADIQAYEQQSGLPQVPLNVVPVAGFNGNPMAFPDGVREVELDIEMVAAMAPGLSQILVYEGDVNTVADNAILAAIADDDAALQACTSWDNPPVSSDTLPILLVMALQGQSFFDVSGDLGSYGGPIYSGNMQDQLYVTVVGGSILTMNGVGSSYLSESAWPGSGGGVSGDVTISAYQSAVLQPNSGASTQWKNVPDVAMVAQNIYAVMTVFDGGTNPIGQTPVSTGGTSASTPLWTAFTALVNQQRANSGQVSLGFASPLLYAVAAGSGYDGAFHDITIGSNGLYSAGKGYDLVTGLGSPAGQPLINALSPNSLPYPTTVPVRVQVPVPTPTATAGVCLSLVGQTSGLRASNGSTIFEPTGEAVDANGNLYVVNQSTGMVETYNASGQPLQLSYGSGPGKGPGQLQQPAGVALDAEGDVFVADEALQRVTKFDSSGNLKGSFGSTVFSYPDGLACDAAGHVYVADFVNSTVFRMNNDGSSIQVFAGPGTGPGEVEKPTGVAVDVSGNVYVMDLGNGVIERYNASGTFLGSWGNPAQFQQPNLLGFAGPGLLFVACGGSQKVEIFDGSGNLQGQLTGFNFSEPFGVAGNKSWLYVSDMTGRFVDVFDMGNCGTSSLSAPPTVTATNTPTFTSTPTSIISCAGGNTVGYSMNPTPQSVSSGSTYAVRVSFTAASLVKGIQVLGGNTGLPMRLGIYDDNGSGLLPTTLLASTVYTDAGGFVTETVQINAEVEAGPKWLAISSAGSRFGSTSFPNFASSSYQAGTSATFSDQMPELANAYGGGYDWDLAALYCPAACTPTGAIWYEATPWAGFGPRDSFGVCVFNDRMWTLGGRTPLGDAGDVFFSSDGSDWTCANTWSPMHGRESQLLLAFDAADGKGSRLWAIGGSAWANAAYTGAPSQVFNDVWSSSDGTNWSEATEGAKFPAGNYVGTVFNNQMWIFGGGSSGQPNQAWSSRDGVTWTQASTVPGSGQASAALAFKGQLVVMERWTNSNVQDMFYTSQDGVNWSSVTPVPIKTFGLRSAFSAFVSWGKIWVIGGDLQTIHGSAPAGDVICSSDGQNWSVADSSAPFPVRSNAAALDFNGDLWVMGGLSTPANGAANTLGYVADVWGTLCKSFLKGSGISIGLLGDTINPGTHMMGIKASLGNSLASATNLAGVELRYWFDSKCENAPILRAWIEGRETEATRGLVRASSGRLSPGSSIRYLSFKFRRLSLEAKKSILLRATARFSGNTRKSCSLSQVDSGSRLTLYQDGVLVSGQEPEAPGTVLSTPQATPVPTATPPGPATYLQ